MKAIDFKGVVRDITDNKQIAWCNNCKRYMTKTVLIDGHDYCLSCLEWEGASEKVIWISNPKETVK